jgi:hypothetical protein
MIFPKFTLAAGIGFLGSAGLQPAYSARVPDRVTNCSKAAYFAIGCPKPVTDRLSSGLAMSWLMEPFQLRKLENRARI